MLPNIALLGPAGSGKTTAAEFLVQSCNYSHLSFAAPIKLIAKELWDKPGRYELQQLGAKVREIHEDTWLKLLDAEMETLDAAVITAPVVIDDCRFPNEYEYLRGEGFKFIRLVVSREEQIARLTANGRWQNEGQLDHISETMLSDYPTDAVYENMNGDMELYEFLVAHVYKWST